MSRPVTMIRDSIPVSGAVLDTHALSSLRSPDIASAFDSTETLEAVQFMLERGVSREYSLAKQRVSTLSKVTGAIQAILDLEPGLKPEDLGPENSVTYGIDAYRARRIMARLRESSDWDAIERSFTGPTPEESPQIPIDGKQSPQINIEDIKSAYTMAILSLNWRNSHSEAARNLLKNTVWETGETDEATTNRLVGFCDHLAGVYEQCEPGEDLGRLDEKHVADSSVRDRLASSRTIRERQRRPIPAEQAALDVAAVRGLPWEEQRTTSELLKSSMTPQEFRKIRDDNRDAADDLLTYCMTANERLNALLGTSSAAATVFSHHASHLSAMLTDEAVWDITMALSQTQKVLRGILGDRPFKSGEKLFTAGSGASLTSEYNVTEGYLVDSRALEESYKLLAYHANWLHDPATSRLVRSANIATPEIEHGLQSAADHLATMYEEHQDERTLEDLDRLWGNSPVVQNLRYLRTSRKQQRAQLAQARNMA